MKKDKKGFTLAEVLITLTILGVVAALTVPSIVHNNQTRINKTRLKKAMATYDKAISQMSAVNRLNNKVLFKQWAEENYCDNAVSYFNIVNSTRNGCKFKTSDGIWWDVSEIDRTLVSFKEQNLTLQKAKDYDDKDAFVLVTSFDDTQGVLRIDDLGYETNHDIDNSKAQVEKLYEFLGVITKNTRSNFAKNCAVDPNDSNKCTLTYNCPTTAEPNKTCTQVYTKVGMTAESVSRSNFCDWDPATKVCTSKSTSESEADEDIWMADIGLYSNWAYKDATAKEICDESRYEDCSTNGDYWTLARKNCEAQGMRLVNSAELLSLKNANKLESASTYWASEANLNSTTYVYRLHTNSSSISTRHVLNDNGRAVCVGK